MRNSSEERWHALWIRNSAQGDPGVEYADLCRRYAEPHRAYHTLAHVNHCLEEFEPARPLASHPDAVELALWYHDAVYNPRATDNEERSAQLVLDVGRKASLPADLIKEAGELILMSKHRELPTDPDGRIFVDVDLAILGQPWERFSEYEDQIRREYAWVPAWLFRRKRSTLLRSLLARPTLYCTPAFQHKYEGRARENIARSLGLPK